MLKVTFEFKTPEEAITAIAKIAGLGQAAPAPRIEIRKPSDIEGESRREPEAQPGPKKERKPRADKGRERGAYKPRVLTPEEEQAIENARSQKADDEARQRMQDQRDAARAQETAAQPASEQTGAGTPESTSAMSGAVAAVPTEGDIQKALEKVFAAKQASGAMALLDKFGVKRGRDLPVEHRAQFIQCAEEACK
jgi:hypothetical protein